MTTVLSFYIMRSEETLYQIGGMINVFMSDGGIHRDERGSFAATCLASMFHDMSMHSQRKMSIT